MVWHNERLAILAVGWAIVALACMGAGLRADETSSSTSGSENPHVWKPRTRSVAVFKNGLGFFLREGEVKLRDGWCVAESVPPAAFGTLAIYAHSDKEVVDIVGSGPGEIVEFDGRDASKDPAARKARLEANRDLKVELQYEQKGQKRTAAGKLVSVGPEYVVLENEGNSLAVPTAGVTRMQVLGASVANSRRPRRRHRRRPRPRRQYPRHGLSSQGYHLDSRLYAQGARRRQRRVDAARHDRQ